MDSVKALTKSVIMKALLLNGVLYLILFAITKDYRTTLAGITFGGGVSILNFLELSNTLQRAVVMNSARAQTFATIKYSVRSVIVAVVIIIAIRAEYISTVGTILGLLSVKTVVWGQYILGEKKNYQDIFKRKEE